MGKKDINKESTKQWMKDHVSKNGFVNATSLAESFLKAHFITDALDPEFSLTLDVAFELSSEIRDKKLGELK